MICNLCNIDKDENEFHFQDKEKIKKRNTCKECIKIYRKEYYDKNRKKAIEYSKKTNIKRVLARRRFIWDYLSNNPCIICGESDPIVLEFDHREPSEKIGSISNMISNGIGLDKVLLEINKCDVLCSNCHKRRTAIQYNWYESINGQDAL